MISVYLYSNQIDDGQCTPITLRDGVPIYPCGLIANSVFNGEMRDVLQLMPINDRLTGFGLSLTDRHVYQPATAQPGRRIRRSSLPHFRTKHRLGRRVQALYQQPSRSSLGLCRPSQLVGEVPERLRVLPSLGGR
jgi:hypothetical protein